MDFTKYKDRIREYLQSKGYSNFNLNIRCFSGNHTDDNPSMHIHDDGFKCHACGIFGDIYDAIGLVEKIADRTDQFRFAEKFFQDNNGYIPVKKQKFAINQDAAQSVTKFMRDLAKTNVNFRLSFAKHRGYSGEDGNNYIKYLGFWPGYQIAEKKLGKKTLLEAGIPVQTEEKPYSSWHRPGVVLRYESGYELLYIDRKDGKTIKRCSHCAINFPFPGLPTDSDHVVLVEGATDVIPCVINNIPAVSIGGTQKFNSDHAKMLHNYKKVIICFNPDEPGKNAAQKSKKILEESGYTGKIIICDLPSKMEGLPENKKVDCDEIIKNGKIDLLKNLLYPKETIKSDRELIARSFVKKSALQAEEIRDGKIDALKEFIYYKPEMAFHEAARLYFAEKSKSGIKRQGDNDTNEMIWIYNDDDKCWKPQVKNLGAIPREMFIEKYGSSWFIQDKKKPFVFSENNHSDNEITSRFKEYVENNLSLESLAFEDINKKIIISCRNCALIWDGDKKEFTKEPHSGKHGLTITPFPYDRLNTKNITEDQQDRIDIINHYLDNLVSWVDDEKDRQKLKKFLLAYIGYTLTPWREKCFFVWIGAQDSGKSTLAKVINMLHSGKCGEVRLNRWNTGNAHDYEVLPGKLVVVDDDFAVGGKLPEQELKTLSGNSRITINPKHISQFSITNTATVLILTNGMPRAEDLSIDNRLYTIPFKANFGREFRNTETQKLISRIFERDTLEMFFNMAIDEAEKTIFTDGKFADDVIPKLCQQTTSEILNTASSVLMWLDDMNEQGLFVVDHKNSEIRIRRSELWKSYCESYQGSGRKGQHSFYEMISQKFKRVKSNGYDYYLGIAKIEKQSENIDFKQE